jgi:hypothetical protein
MKKFLFVIFCLSIIVVSFSPAAFSKSFQLRSRSEYIQGVSSAHKDETQYAHKLSLNRDFQIGWIGRAFNVGPYTELTYNFETDELSKTESGLAAEVALIKYIAFYCALQYATINKHHTYICAGEDKNNFEVLGGPVFTLPLPLRIARHPLCLRAQETYIYDLDSHRGTRNEVTGGIFWEGGKYLDLGIKWRHIDHVHYTDIDEVAGVLTLIF